MIFFGFLIHRFKERGCVQNHQRNERKDKKKKKRRKEGGTGERDGLLIVLPDKASLRNPELSIGGRRDDSRDSLTEVLPKHSRESSLLRSRGQGTETGCAIHSLSLRKDRGGGGCSSALSPDGPNGRMDGWMGEWEKATVSDLSGNEETMKEWKRKRKKEQRGIINRTHLGEASFDFPSPPKPLGPDHRSP